jgi:Zn-dependent protease
VDYTSIAIGLGIILVALSVHEAAHAWSADRLGDPTARLLGRLTLNPIRHIDPIGTVLMPALMIATGLPILGWAKPVPVNISRLGHPRRDFMIVAAAGPLSNIAQAVVAGILLRALLFSGADPGLTGTILIRFMQINLILAFFNLIPIPPLDGGNVLAGLLPPPVAGAFDRIRPFGFLLLYGLILTDVLFMLILPPTLFMLELLLP